MTREQKEDLTFRVVISFSRRHFENRKVYYHTEEILRKLEYPGLEDAHCLLRMAIKEIEAHNSKMSAKISLLEKMRYTPKYLQSNLFSDVSIPLKKIDKLIEENPDKDYYQIFQMLLH